MCRIHFTGVGLYIIRLDAARPDTKGVGFFIIHVLTLHLHVLSYDLQKVLMIGGPSITEGFSRVRDL